MSDVFLSYVRTDRPTAAQLARALEAQGWTVWWDHLIAVGEAFEATITSELKTAKCVVVLWSTGSVASDWVRDEAGEAKRRGVLVPCIIDEVQPPLGFRQYQTADLVKWTGDVEAEAFDILRRAIARHSPTRTNTKFHSSKGRRRASRLSPRTGARLSLGCFPVRDAAVSVSVHTKSSPGTLTGGRVRFPSRAPSCCL